MRGARMMLMGTVLATMVVCAASAATETPAPRPRSLLESSPGFRPAADPESASVALGRRANAPLVTKRFSGGAKSLDALGRAVCRAVHHSRADSLLALCVSEGDFRDILWREFPQSRPATGLTWVDGWRVLYARHYGGCNGAVRDYGDRHHELVRVEVDSVQVFRNFRLHRGVTLVVRDDNGEERRWTWLRAIVERRGAFKIYSTDD